MWCEIFACGKHPGQGMTWTIFCLLLTTFPHQNINIQITEKNQNSEFQFNWFQRISKRVFPKLCPSKSLTFKEREVLLCNFHSKLQEKIISSRIKEWRPWAKWPLEESSVSQEGHWLCIHVLLSHWLGAAHRKWGSITNMQ